MDVSAPDRGVWGVVFGIVMAGWRMVLKVDEGRIHDSLKRLEEKVDTLDLKVDGVSERLARIEGPK